MKRVTLGAFPLLLSMSAVGLLIAQRERPPITKAEQERLLAIGKKFFMERCAKCHDELGDKPLASGPPLNQRDLSDEKIARAVSGRFRDKSDEEKRAVTLYIRSFMKRK